MSSSMFASVVMRVFVLLMRGLLVFDAVFWLCQWLSKLARHVQLFIRDGVCWFIP